MGNNAWKRWRRQTRKAARNVTKGTGDAQTLIDSLARYEEQFKAEPSKFHRELSLVDSVREQLGSKGYEWNPSPVGDVSMEEYLAENPVFGAGNPLEMLGQLAESGFKARDYAAGVWQDQMDSPFLAALEGQVSAGLENPLVSDQDLAGLLAGSSDTLSRSYMGDMAGLQNQMGGLNIDPSSGIAQELGAALRFGTLQEQAKTDIGTRLDVKQLNRSALENMLQMGQGLTQTRAGLAQGLSGVLMNSTPYDIGLLQPAGADILNRKAKLR